MHLGILELFLERCLMKPEMSLCIFEQICGTSVAAVRTEHSKANVPLFKTQWKWWLFSPVVLTASISQHKLRKFLIPSLLVFSSPITQHIDQRPVEPLNHAVRLTPKRGGSRLRNVQHNTYFLKEMCFKLPSLINMYNLRWSKSTDKLVNKYLPNCFHCLVWKWICLDPFGEVVRNDHKIFVTFMRHRQWTQQINGHTFQRSSKNTRAHWGFCWMCWRFTSITVLARSTIIYDVSLHNRTRRIVHTS